MSRFIRVVGSALLNITGAAQPGVKGTKQLRSVVCERELVEQTHLDKIVF